MRYASAREVEHWYVVLVHQLRYCTVAGLGNEEGGSKSLRAEILSGHAHFLVTMLALFMRGLGIRE